MSVVARSPASLAEPTANSQVSPQDSPAAGAVLPEVRLGLPSRVAVFVLTSYQGAASGRVSPCRFYPSCSSYAVEAFSVHGFWRGLALTARRLLRCRPFGPHGVDLVPLRADSPRPTPTAPSTPTHAGGHPC